MSDAQLPRRGSYGFDAPYAPLLMGALTVYLLTSAVYVAWTGGGARALLPGIGGVFCLANVTSFLYTTRVGKFRIWSTVIDQLGFRGDEQLLDMGCGRGAVLLLAAQRLPRGRGTGIDLWSTKDQSGNAERVTLRNAELEGVAQRVELRTGDMRNMPFADGTFDVVVSSLAIHNISDGVGRAKAIREAARVLKPGGRLAIADFRCTDAYVAELRTAGISDVKQQRLDWRFWYGGPWAATKLVTGSKPVV